MFTFLHLYRTDTKFFFVIWYVSNFRRPQAEFKATYIIKYIYTFIELNVSQVKNPYIKSNVKS